MTASQQSSCRKKGHVSLQNILPVQRRKKKRGNMWERERERGRQSVSTSADNMYQAHKKKTHNSKVSWVTTVPLPTHRWVVYLWHNIWTNTRAHPSLSPSSGCFCTSDLYQHLSRLLNSWHQRVVCKIASYILSETRCVWHSTQTVNKYLTHMQPLNSKRFIN